MTGGNTGIGLEAALELAYTSATIILAGRDEAKNLKMVEMIKEKTKNINIFYIKLNLSSLNSVKQFSTAFHK